MTILPIPTTRVSDFLARTRLTRQAQADQADLFRLQSQISTGRRIFRPSEDGRSALRSITLQRTLERQTQLQVNLNAAQSSLIAGESSLNGVGSILNEIRAEALGVAGTTSSDAERLAVRTDVFTALEELVTLANSTYQDNFLFAGSRALEAPYEFNGTYVEYRGNETDQRVRVDTGVLFNTNIPGDESFGGLSEPVLGSAQLSPHLSTDTLLTDLNGGLGITEGGSIEIAYVPSGSVFETESATIDLSNARTVGDVIRAIETGGPPSADLRVSVTGSGLTIEVEPGSGTPGAIAVREVAAGETAAELGIATTGVTSVVTGNDLTPRIGLTTRLDSLLGTKSQTRLSLSGSDNDLVITANSNGAALNGTEITIVNGAVSAGSESAVFTPGAPPTLQITIASGESTAAQVAAAINNEPSGAFSAEIDFRDALSPSSAGGGIVTEVVGLAGVTDSSGGGEQLDLASGLRITNGEAPFDIDTSGAETVEDLLNLLNGPENGLHAEINATRTGINIRTRRSGADFSIGEGDADNDGSGSLATQLGVRSTTADSRLEDFNRGLGVIDELSDASSNVLTIQIDDAGSTTVYQVDLNAVNNVQDVIDQIAADSGGVVTASLAAVGNGLTLTTNIGVVPPSPGVGSFTLEGDTLTVTADADGFAGNQSFTFEVIDSGSGGLSTQVVGNAIQVDLGGADSTTDAIATDISTQLTGFTVVSNGTAAVATTSPVVGATPAAFDTLGGNDGSAAGADQITITGDIAQRLGFFDETQTSATSTSGSITSEDRNTIEVDSVFNSLLRLGEALLGGLDTVPDIGRAIERLDVDLDRVTSARGEVGARLKSLESLEIRLQDEEVELRASLSEELDVDLTQAISDFTARQFSLQASLQTTANLLQLTILNFI